MLGSTIIIGILAACSPPDDDSGDGPDGPPVTNDTHAIAHTGDTSPSWGTGVVAATGLRDSALDDTQDTFRGDLPGTIPVDTDTDTAPPEDSATVCGYNEIKDCNDVCYPSYYLGDGYCDDGGAFASDFDCPMYHEDMGDCSDDTGGPVGASCPLMLTFITQSWASEIGFSITDAAGNDVLSAGAGFLPNNHETYEFPIWLESGEYTFEMTDSFGDGWHGGYVEIVDPFTSTVLGGGSSDGTIGYGYSDTFAFDFTCDPTASMSPASCSIVTLTVDTHNMVGDFADELGWELLDEQGNLVDAAAYGTYNEDTSTETSWDLADGLYTFRMMDSFHNGWDGATYTIEDGRSLTLRDGTKTTLTESQDVMFQVACNSTYQVPPVIVNCDQLDLRIVADVGASGIGLSLHEIHQGEVGAFAPGTLDDPIWGTDVWLFDELDPGWNSPWTTTDYTVVLVDQPADGSTPDGWGSSRAELYDTFTGQVYRTWGSGTSGALNAYEFSLLCTNQMVPPTPDTSTICTDDAEADCDGLCWPTTYLGDGYCDDGVQSPGNFACDAFDWDDGDCEAP